MSQMMDFLDEFVLGPLNLIDLLDGLIVGAFFGDFGFEISIPRTDKSGAHSLNEVRELLSQYGVATYGRRFDSRNMYIRVKKRQARWAEYVLLHAGVELLNPAFDHRNAGYAARHAPGWMPRPWSAGRADAPDQKVGEVNSPDQKQPKAKGLLDWLDSLGT